MSAPDTKSADDAEVVDAYRKGCDAVVYLADAVESLANELRSVANAADYAPDPKRLLVPILEHTISPLMNAIGDALNACDAVEDADEAATREAYRRVARVIENHGHNSVGG